MHFKVTSVLYLQSLRTLTVSPPAAAWQLLFVSCKFIRVIMAKCSTETSMVAGSVAEVVLSTLQSVYGISSLRDAFPSQFMKYCVWVLHFQQCVTLCSYLRMNSLNMGVQIPLLGEGCRAEHAEVRFLSSVSRHVSLQHHLLVESLTAMCALVRPLTWREGQAQIRLPS